MDSQLGKIYSRLLTALEDYIVGLRYFEFWRECKAIMSRSILDYFSKKQSEAHLPDPRGSLSSKMLPSTIAAANTEVMHVTNGHAPLPS